MMVYLVGGAVRDRLLGLPVKERDYVVVGATEQEMLNKGFRSVGRDFPVFLHPETNEEYALARTERKTGPGHQGFACHFTPDVTLEEDLGRRDLTINAMAIGDSGELIDPWGGQDDLADKQLRHVSQAFIEDPLRILRVCRFLAHLHHLGFRVADETDALLRRMVSDGMLRELTPERVLMELDKALQSPSPAVFFSYLDELGGAAMLWPEIDIAAVTRLRRVDSDNVEARFCALLQEVEPAAIDRLCKRLTCSRSRTELARLFATHYRTWSALDSLDAGAIVEFLNRTDAVRKKARFTTFNAICADILAHPLAARWQALADAVSAINARDLDTTASGPELGRLVEEARVRAVKTKHGQ